ncbi:hypothetical protein WN55_10079 [Dufourea novaeangliae]|uniref:Uncharacterized protein n=1 Tax=Dufourea novaeangliae TaxID=178035 RepID=A0A154P7W2_DUFNO|nr:hypothetical protein WN55_10079 [Dufourea novaeangliae]
MQCGLCAVVAGLFRRAMCIAGSRRGSGESCYQELTTETQARRHSQLAPIETGLKAAEIAEHVKEAVETQENPHANTRQLARESGISQRCVSRILHLNKLHAFHFSLHQELHNTLLEDVPLPIRRNMWFMHDGAPPHYFAVREHLNEYF